MLAEVQEGIRPPFVEFERRAVENKSESLAQGRWVGKDVDYAVITPPHSRDIVYLTVDAWWNTMKREIARGNMKKEWLDGYQKKYQMWLQGQELPPDGTPIKNWSAISPAEVKTLTGLNIYTVEDLALCNENDMRHIGMGARSLIDKAKAWIKSTKDHGSVTLENSNLKKENENLKAELETLKKKLNVPKMSLVDNNKTITKDELFGEDSMEDAVKMYQERFGKKPHHKMKLETIMAELEK